MSRWPILNLAIRSQADPMLLQSFAISTSSGRSSFRINYRKRPPRSHSPPISGQALPQALHPFYLETGQAITDKLVEIATAFAVDEKVSAIVHDQAANMELSLPGPKQQQRVGKSSLQRPLSPTLPQSWTYEQWYLQAT